MPTAASPPSYTATAGTQGSKQGTTNAQSAAPTTGQNASSSSVSSNNAAPGATQAQPNGSPNSSTAPVANGATAPPASAATAEQTFAAAWQSIFSGPSAEQRVPAFSFTNSTTQGQPGAVNGAGTLNQTRNHDEFYFSDGNALLQAGEVLFRVHWSVLSRHSKEFERMATGATGNLGSASVKGLGFIHPADFARLLTIIYYPSPAKQVAWSVDEWLSVMEQAQRWSMSHIKDYAIQQLSAIDMAPLTKIALWKKHKFDETQLVPSYAALCMTEKPLSEETLNQLGAQAFVKLVDAREKFRTVLLTTPAAALFEGKIRTALAEQIVESVFFPND